MTHEPSYVSGTEPFSESEKKDIAKALSDALGIEFRVAYSDLQSADVIPILTVALYLAGGAIIGGFLAKMGSDAFDIAKEKIVQALAKRRHNENTRLELHLEYGGAKVTCFVKGQNPDTVGKAIDAWKTAVEEVRNMVDKKNMPGEEVILFYNFNGMKWEMTDATVMKPFFDKVQLNPLTQEWQSVDPRASAILKKYQQKLKEKS